MPAGRLAPEALPAWRGPWRGSCSLCRAVIKCKGKDARGRAGHGGCPAVQELLPGFALTAQGKGSALARVNATPPAPARAGGSHPAGGLQSLDGMRGLAAFYVMAGHARWLLWEGYSEGYQKHPGSYSALGKALVYFSTLFRYGHQAVLFFFVLSGFVIHLRYARQLEKEGGAARFDWGPFLWRRARRLYPPLLAALALTLCLDHLGQARGYAIYHQATPYRLINETIVPRLDLGTALGNLGFVMTTYVPVYGGNTPLWSLKFEWWFYMFYPLFWLLSRRSITLATGIMAGLFVASFFSVLWPVRLFQEVFGSMLAWWLGVLLADVFAGRLRWRWRRAGLGTAVAGGWLAGLSGVFPAMSDLGVALLFASLLAGLFRLEKEHVNLRWLERLKPLGDMSYTLYVTHFPILVLGSGWLMRQAADGRLPRGFGFVLLGMTLATLVAYLLHLVVERPFPQWRRRKAPGH